MIPLPSFKQEKPNPVQTRTVPGHNDREQLNDGVSYTSLSGHKVAYAWSTPGRKDDGRFYWHLAEPCMRQAAWALWTGPVHRFLLKPVPFRWLDGRLYIRRTLPLPSEGPREFLALMTFCPSSCLLAQRPASTNTRPGAIHRHCCWNFITPAQQAILAVQFRLPPRTRLHFPDMGIIFGVLY